MTGETLPIPTSIIDTVPGEHFLLKVHGDSMADAGIAAGDWVIVREQPSSASEGDTIAAMVDGDAIVTTTERMGDGVIIGVVVTVLKRR